MEQKAEKGTQIIQSPAKDVPHEAYVPFLLRSQRFKKLPKTQSPPVGTYAVKSCFDSAPHLNKTCVFKSSIDRFIQAKPQERNFISCLPLFQSVKRKDKRVIFRVKEASPQKTCPSIPNQSLKHGYTFDNGSIIPIFKPKQKVEYEKKLGQVYAQTLDGEKIKTSSSFHSKLIKQKPLEKVVTNIINKYQLHKPKTQDSIRRYPKKPNLFKSSPKIKQIKLYESPNVGPGSYDPHTTSFNLKLLNQQFQFFGSTEVRFKTANIQIENERDYSPRRQRKQRQLIKRDKILPYRLQKLNQHDVNAMEDIAPGPGQYYARDQIIRKSNQNTVFSQEQRFKQTPISYSPSQPSTVKQLARPILKGNLRKEPLKAMYIQHQPTQNVVLGFAHNKQNNDNRKLSKMKKQKKVVQFGSNCERFQLPKEQNQPFWLDNIVLKNEWQCKTGSYISSYKVNKQQHNKEQIGPGAYQTNSPKKKTFNIKYIK